MKPLHQQQHFYPPHHAPNYTKSTPIHSASSSSENMHPEDDRRIREQLFDPSIEVDLDMFLMPNQPHQTPPMAYMGARAIRGSARQQLHQSRDGVTQPIRKDPWKQHVESQTSLRSCSTSGIGSSATSSVQSQTQPLKCQYCWESYAEAHRQITNTQPSVAIDGPWNWHSFHDENGRVRCPRMWFLQYGRAGIDAIRRQHSTIF